jgi:hypothetical protein
MHFLMSFRNIMIFSDIKSKSTVDISMLAVSDVMLSCSEGSPLKIYCVQQCTTTGMLVCTFESYLLQNVSGAPSI